MILSRLPLAVVHHRPMGQRDLLPLSPTYFRFRRITANEAKVDKNTLAGSGTDRPSAMLVEIIPHVPDAPFVEVGPIDPPCVNGVGPGEP